MYYRLGQLLVIVLLFTQGLWRPVAAAPLYQQTGVALETPFELVIGDEALVGDASDAFYIFFAGVLRDSRCPTGTQCVKAGEALFQLIMTSAERQDSEILEIGTASDDQVVNYQGHTIELVAVDPPAPKPDENYILIEYHLTLVVRAGVATPTPEPTAEPAADTPPQVEPAPGLEPQLVDRCVNFTPFDAAAVLQEPVNADEPIGNIVFGPLSADFWDEEGGVQGFCGYASTIPQVDQSDPGQTHIVTQLATDHAVVAQHLSADVVPTSNGTVLTDWFDLFALAEVVGAANPEHDSEAVFDILYNFAGHFPLLEILQADVSNAPSFTMMEVPLGEDDPRDELFWFWQTLDEGYFSLLISRQDLAFDIVAARLGAHVQEKTVLGYSRVILDKLTDTATADPESDVTSACDWMSLDDVGAIVGEAVQGQVVRNEDGEGCKYTPVADDLAIDPADFSSGFQTHGLLAGIVPPAAAKRLLSGMIEELSTTGQVTDGVALGELLVAVEDEAWRDALAQIAQLDWDSNAWQVEALTAISDATLLIHGKSGSGWPKFFVLQPHSDGGLYYLAGETREEIATIYDAIVTAAQQFTAQVAVTATDEPTTVTTGEATVVAKCTFLTMDEAAALLGEPVQGYAVAGERGEGCKYIPATEGAWVEPDDFTPRFESHGVLAGVMPTDGAQWLLSELLGLMELDEAPQADLQAAVEAGEIGAALQQLATLEGTAGEWQIEALPDVGEDAIQVYSMMEGYRLTFFFRSKAETELVMIALQLPADRDVEAMGTAAVAALQKLGE